MGVPLLIGNFQWSGRSFDNHRFIFELEKKEKKVLVFFEMLDERIPNISQIGGRGGGGRYW